MATYSYLHIDRKSPEISFFAQQYRELRLNGLKESPQSFSSTYEAESKFPDDVWLARLTLPGRETFVCVKSSESGTAGGRGQTQWVAQVTLLGPIPEDVYRKAGDASAVKVLPDEDEDKWQMLSLFTLPTEQGKGLGRGLCQKAFEYLSRETHGPPKIRLRIMILRSNLLAIKMYSSLGFVDAGQCTLAEGLFANGDGNMVPTGDDDAIRERYHTKGGVTMILQLRRS